MRQLWAPWRLEYIQGQKQEGCIFCQVSAGSEDQQRLVVARGARCFVILNLFPYNTGHAMVVPYRHRSRLEELDEDELRDLMRYTDYTLRVQEQVLHAEGFNVGMNLGRAAGAGIDDHLHIHVVPRWVGDSNYMPVIGDVKVIPEHLAATRQRLAEGFEALLGRSTAESVEGSAQR